MTSRERVIRTLRFQGPDRTPRDLYALPGVRSERLDEYEKMLRRYPRDFAQPDSPYGKSRRARGAPGAAGTYVDEWGCVWRAAEPGVCGEVIEPPLADWSALSSYELPWELLNEADFSKVNDTCVESRCFVLGGGHTHPFERAQFLRGAESLYRDLGYGTKELFILLDRLHEFFCEEMRLWAGTAVDGGAFMDDWGSQDALLIAPEHWRRVFKPMYRDYCDILHGKGKFVFFHSDGHIAEIFPDLIEIGVDAVNSQLFCMDIEELGRRHRGKITFWGEIDRQRVLPFGRVEEVRQAVRRVRTALETRAGGMIAQCEWGLRNPFENIAAVYDEWSKPLPEPDTPRTS